MAIKTMFALDPDQIIRLDMSAKEIESILEILLFAYDTAKFVAEVEAAKGSAGGVNKLKHYMAEADLLMNKLYATLAMLDRPEDAKLN